MQHKLGFATAVKTPIAGLPTLKPNSGAVKYNQWADSLHNRVQEKYPELAIVIRTREPYSEPEIEDINIVYNDANDPASAMRIMREARIKARARSVIEQKAQLKGLFATIWNQISAESEELIQLDVVRHMRQQYADLKQALDDVRAYNAELEEEGEGDPIPEPILPANPDNPNVMPRGVWEYFREASDPVQLLQSAYRTHLLHSHVDRSKEKELARNEHERLRQYPAESLHSYRLRYMASIAGLEATDQAVYAQDVLSYNFLMRLNSDYKPLKTQLDVSVKLGTSVYPTTLDQAYELAMLFRPTDEKKPKHTAAAADASTATPGSPSGDSELAFSVTRKATKTKQNKSHSTPSTNSSAAGAGTGPAPEAKKVPRTPCKVCSSLERPDALHWFADCPLLSKLKTLDKRGALISTSFHTNPNVVVLDSGSSVHLFANPRLLTEIVANSDNVIVGGIVGEDFHPKFSAVLPQFGPAYHDPSINANLLSMGLVESVGTIEHLQDCKVVTVGNSVYRFDKHQNLYLCEFADVKHVSLMSTVAEAESSYTGNEVKAAKQAQTFIERLGYPASDLLCKSINSGVLINVPVTSSDIRRADKLYGTVPTLKGKMTTPTPTSMRDSTNPIDNASDKVEQTLHLDTITVLGSDFLISFAVPLGLVSVEYLAEKSTNAQLAKLNLYCNEDDLVWKAVRPRWLGSRTRFPVSI
jgi:hypothetical protein